MILFPNAKINLGLSIVGIRHDGYHDIVTIMVPVGWRDILEITPSKGNKTTLTTWGRHVACSPEKNLVMKAYEALSSFTEGLPPVDINLEKIIPDGAGLGGGSSDAAFTILGLNELFNLGLSKENLAKVAVKVGADCPFFIYNVPALCEGIGDRISFDITPRLIGKHILIAKPRVASISTKEAYAGISPHPLDIDMPKTIASEPAAWKGVLKNDFENSIFPKVPQIAELKRAIIDGGAEYASMSGSGAAVYGIFDSDILAHDIAANLHACDKIVTKALFLND